jgi:hypothetical protein
LGSLSPAALALTAAFAAVAVIAAAVTVAIGLYNDSLKDQVAAVNAASDARKEADELAVSGATVSQAQAQLEQLQALREKAFARQLRAQQEYNDASFNWAEQGFSSLEEAREAAIKKERDEIIILEARITALSENLENGSFAADKASDSQAALTQAQAAAAQAQKQASQAVRQDLTPSIKELASTANSASKQVSQASETMWSGISEDAYKAMQDAYKARQAETRKMLEEQQKQRNELIKMANDYTQGEIDARRDAYRSELEATIKQQRDLQKIRDDANKREKDAIRSGDVFAIRDIREGLAESLRESSSDFEVARQDRARSASEAEQDRLNDYQQRRAEAQGITFNITNADPMQTAMIVQQQIARMRR